MFKEYFNKLEVSPRVLSLSLVEEIQKKHLEKFSFNNIAVLLQEEIFLDIENIMNKVVRKNMGGYCFEHNKLMHDVLKSLGFNVRMLVGRVINNQVIDTPKTHRITLLEFESKRYLIDVGFGAMCPPFPLCINEIGEAQNKYRIIKTQENVYQLELLKKENYFSLYIFDLDKYKESDCIMGNFYSSNYKNAVFVNNLVIASVLPDKVMSLRNNSFHIITQTRTDISDIKSANELHSIINEEFKIPLNKARCVRLFEKIKEKNCEKVQ